MSETPERDAAADHWPVTIQRHVRWGEMDAFGHLNNTVYFRFFEDVRIAHFEHLGVMARMARDQVGPILASTQARFRAALTYPDEVRIASRIRDLQEDRFSMVYRVESVALDRIACEGEGRIVYYDYGRQEKCPVPASIRSAIEAEL